MHTCDDARMCLQMAKVNLSEQHEDDEELCVVCWEKAPEVIFCHCMHRVRSCNPEPACLSVRCGLNISCMPGTAELPGA